MNARALLVTLTALSAACSNDNYSYASVTMPEGDPSATVDLGAGGTVTLAEGAAVEATITFMANNGDTLQGEIVSEDPSILTVLPVMGASAYVFSGVSAGTTSIEVVVGGRDVQTVPAVVTALPATSVPPTIDAGLLSGVTDAGSAGGADVHG